MHSYGNSLFCKSHIMDFQFRCVHRMTSNKGKQTQIRAHTHIPTGDTRDWERVEVVCWFAIFDSLIKETFVLHDHFVRSFLSSVCETCCVTKSFIFSFFTLSFSFIPSLWHPTPLCVLYLVRLIPFFYAMCCVFLGILFCSPIIIFPTQRSKIPQKR